MNKYIKDFELKLTLYFPNQEDILTYSELNISDSLFFISCYLTFKLFPVFLMIHCGLCYNLIHVAKNVSYVIEFVFHRISLTRTIP